jgi:protein-S-isoprenylcysteine O-methyltransferase Ste14
MNLLNIDSLILFKRLSLGSLALCIASMLLAIGTPPILQIIFTLSGTLFGVYFFLFISLIINEKQMKTAQNFMDQNGYNNLTLTYLIIRLTLLTLALFAAIFSGLVCYFLISRGDLISIYYALSCVVFFVGAALLAKALFIGLKNSPHWKKHVINCIAGCIVITAIPSVFY